MKMYLKMLSVQWLPFFSWSQFVKKIVYNFQYSNNSSDNGLAQYPAIVQIMAWRRPAYEPLSEPMMVCLLTHVSLSLNELNDALRPEQSGCYFANNIYSNTSGFYTKGRPLVKSNLICPSDKLSWQPGCPVLNINIQGIFCISQGNGSPDNLPENLVWTPAHFLNEKWFIWIQIALRTC